MIVCGRETIGAAHTGRWRQRAEPVEPLTEVDVPGPAGGLLPGRGKPRRGAPDTADAVEIGVRLSEAFGRALCRNAPQTRDQ